MQTRSWNLIYGIGLVVFTCIRVVFGRRAKSNVKAVSRVDRLERILVTFLGLGYFTVPIYLFTPWFAFADYHHPVFAPWCGLVLMVAALWLFYCSHADLGQNWSITLEIRKGHQLVTQGVYRSIRHPMYASFWLWCFVQGLMLENWLAG